MAIKPIIILLAGASGSGKNEVANRIVGEIGKENVEHIELDMFYKDLGDIPIEERHKVDFDNPNSLDWFAILHAVMCLKEGKEATIPKYDFATHTRIPGRERTAKPKPIVILNSHMALWHEVLRKLADYKFFVDADLDTCLIRRQERDVRSIEEGGRGRTDGSVRTQWHQVREAYIIHFKPTELHADITIPNKGIFNEIGISIIIGWLKYLLLTKSQQKAKRSHKRK